MARRRDHTRRFRFNACGSAREQHAPTSLPNRSASTPSSAISRGWQPGRVSLEPQRQDTEERVRAAITGGATSWRAVGAEAGVSHETARQVGKRLGIRPQKETSRVNVTTEGKPRPRPRPRASLWDERVIARFWEKVDLHGEFIVGYQELGRCWTWTGPVSSANYGILSALGTQGTAAHKYS